MSGVICIKCNTQNKPNAEKCINCGFPFSIKKMETVKRYTSEKQNEPDHSDSSGFSEELYAHKSETEKGKIKPIENSPIDSSNENQVEGLTFSKNIKGDGIIENSESTSQPDAENESTPNEHELSTKNDDNCIKCGYILSGASRICPNCGHNNEPIAITVRMPASENAENDPYGNEPVFPPKDKNDITIAFPSGLSNFKNTVAENNYGTDFPFMDDGQNEVDHIAGHPDRTIREGYDDQLRNESKTTAFHESTEKSPTRLEAIFLGQDTEQKMVINFNENQSELIIDRSIINDEDTTLSQTNHAVIRKIEGKWILSNNASNKAVFVQVRDNLEIHDGDVIMFGGENFYVFVNVEEK